MVDEFIIMGATQLNYSGRCSANGESSICGLGTFWNEVFKNDLMK